MTQEEAFEKLELEVGASQQEIQSQYQEFYNEFQMLITNAPTEHQKSLYQSKFKQLEAAFTLLKGKDNEDEVEAVAEAVNLDEASALDADVSLTSLSDTVEPVQVISSPQPTTKTLTKTAAMQLLGMQEAFTKDKLENAFKAKKEQGEALIKKAIDQEMVQSTKRALVKIENAYKLLLPLAEAPAPKAQASSDTVSKPTKKIPKMLWVGLLVLVLAGAFLVLKPWKETLDPAVQQQFTTLKVEANLLAKQKNWQDALSKYQAAAAILPDAAVQDSIVAMESRLKAQVNMADDEAWEKAKETNTIASYNVYKTTHQNGLHTQAADSAIAKIDAYVNSEAYIEKAAAEKAAVKRKAYKEQQRLRALESARKEKALAEQEQLTAQEKTAQKEALEEQQRLIALEKERKEKERWANLRSPIQSLLNSFVAVEGGTFLMGCTSEQRDCDSDEKPVHRVWLSSFSMGKYEVTQAQWQAVMGKNPSKFKNCDNCPVENVSPRSIQKFIKKLEVLTGKRFRLPTEAEWEYAARGGKRSQGYRYAGGNNLSSVAWSKNNSRKRTHPVGQKKPNELGLYDMSGNVWEWCSDWYGKKYYSNSSSSDPGGPNSGLFKVLRGGSWGFKATTNRVSSRCSYCSAIRYANYGFRLISY